MLLLVVQRAKMLHTFPIFYVRMMTMRVQISANLTRLLFDSPSRNPSLPTIRVFGFIAFVGLSS